MSLQTFAGQKSTTALKKWSIGVGRVPRSQGPGIPGFLAGIRVLAGIRIGREIVVKSVKSSNRGQIVQIVVKSSKRGKRVVK